MNEFEPLSENREDFCFFDTETRAIKGLADPRWGDVTKSGVQRYSRSAKVTILIYAIGDGPVKEWILWDFDKDLRWIDAPPDLLKFMSRALKGEAWFVAWNSGFDRNVCNHSMVRGGKALAMPVRCVIDAMAQAVAANLPAGLGRAHKAIGGGGKLEEGKHLIQLFAPADGGTPDTHPDEFEQFIDYAVQDVAAMREVFWFTRPLWRWEWEQFWASEVINDTGLPIDQHSVERAAYLSDLYQSEVQDRVSEFTRGVCYSVNQHVALAQWVYDMLEAIPEAQSILAKRYAEDDEGILVPDKISVERKRIEKLLPLLERIDREKGLTDDEYDALQLLEVKEFGASATPKKFAKMLPMLTSDERLCGQYVYNGAQQTGRFSSRGLQLHNLTRAVVGQEEDKTEMEVEALEFIANIELPDDRL